jgi:hypothetical protein
MIIDVNPYRKNVAEIKSTLFKIFFPNTVALPKEKAAKREYRAASDVRDPVLKSGIVKPKARK